MICEKPFIKHPLLSEKDVLLSDEARLAATPFPCGRCLPCRINRGRMWVHRLLLEQLDHESSIFLTLTYNEDTIPKGGTLVAKHLTDFFKRLRYYIHPRKIRYFGVGEYGVENGRPHYHAAVFGLYFEDQERVESAWPSGFVLLGELNESSARYICRYVAKGWTFKYCNKLDGRHPEFMRCSKNPGLGANVVKKIAAELRYERRKVIREFLHGRKRLPLGRYLTERLCSELGESGKALREFWDYQQEIFDEHMDEDKIYKDSIMKGMERDLVKVRGKHKFFKQRNTL